MVALEVVVGVRLPVAGEVALDAPDVARTTRCRTARTRQRTGRSPRRTAAGCRRGGRTRGCASGRRRSARATVVRAQRAVVAEVAGALERCRPSRTPSRGTGTRGCRRSLSPATRSPRRDAGRRCGSRAATRRGRRRRTPGCRPPPRRRTEPGRCERRDRGEHHPLVLPDGARRSRCEHVRVAVPATAGSVRGPHRKRYFPQSTCEPSTKFASRRRRCAAGRHPVPPRRRRPFAALLEALPYRKDDLTASYRDDIRALRRRGRLRGAAGSTCAAPGRRTGSPTDEYPDAERSRPRPVIDWLATQPWSNGRVGMFGTSYSGFNSLQMAAEGVPRARRRRVPCTPPTTATPTTSTTSAACCGRSTSSTTRSTWSR